MKLERDHVGSLPSMGAAHRASFEHRFHLWVFGLRAIIVIPFMLDIQEIPRRWECQQALTEMAVLDAADFASATK
jgi:hypothetical protein